MKNNLLKTLCLIFCLVSLLTAQTGGNYTITQSVIAGGGGQNSVGSSYALDGTIGQPIAGQTASGSTFTLSAGFWTPTNFMPTAADATVSGRVTTAGGRGVMNVTVSLTGASGVTRETRTGSFGYFRFDDVEAGQTYIVTAAAKRFTFENPTQVISVFDSVVEINFIALESPIKLKGF